MIFEAIVSNRFNLRQIKTEARMFLKSANARRETPDPSDKYAHYNHHHELTDDHQLVDFGDGEFVANKAAVPLLKALNEGGLRTRTHHMTGTSKSFVSILLDNVELEVRKVNEACGRTKYNGKTELLIRWDASREAGKDAQ